MRRIELLPVTSYALLATDLTHCQRPGVENGHTANQKISELVFAKWHFVIPEWSCRESSFCDFNSCKLSISSPLSLLNQVFEVLKFQKIKEEK
jgi:hypothetical protein